jgi:iron complex outermembrane receptor protein
MLKQDMARVLAGCTGCGWVAVAGVALAQDPIAAGRTASGGLEEVTVTARKRDENVQNTPVSMVALSGADIEARSVASFKDLTSIAPNLEINGGIPNGGGSAAQLFIRGVGQDDYAFPNEPGVGLYIDDVYVARSAGGDFGFMDIERIEVLRGPQGTLYGRNTIGGAVKVITEKPDGEFGARLSATVGDYDRRDFQGSVKFGLGENWSAKVAAGTRERDGLGTNFRGQDLGETDQQMARGALRFNPSSDLDVVFRADWLRQRQAGPAGSMVFFQEVPGVTDGLINGLLAPITAAELGLQPPFDQYGAAYVRTLDACGECVFDSGGNEETRDWADSLGLSATVEWSIGDVAAKSITAYREQELDVRRDSEHTPFEIVRVDNPEESETISQEFQFTGTSFDGRLQWVTGLFAMRDEGESELLAPLLSGLFDLIAFDLTALINAEYEGQSYAAFGEGTWAFTDRLGITVGGRVTRDEKEYVYGLRRPESGAEPLPPTTQEETWTEFLPKVGFEFQQTDSLLWFGNVSRGYKAGGYNARALSGNPPVAYDPEFITQFELGVKSRFADDRVQLNAAVFMSDYEDIQLLSVVDLGGGNVETTISNAAEATILGAEIELTALVVENLEASLGVGLLDTEYDDIGESAQTAGITLDNKLINAPETSINAALDYRWPFANGASLNFRADASYREEQYRDAKNNVQLRADSYTIVNARIAFRSADDRWEAAMFGTNLGDELYITNGVEVLGLGYIEAYYNRPREWGATLTYRF